MSRVAPGMFRLSPEERAERDRRDYERSFIRDGESYSTDYNHIWYDGFTFLGSKRMRWIAHIRWESRAEGWPIIATSPFFKHKWQATRWAVNYFKRGGPE